MPYWSIGKAKLGGSVEQERGFKLSREISIADIVAVIGIGIPAMIWAGKMDARLSQVEAAIITARAETIAKDTRQDVERESLRKEVKEDLREINRKLDKIIERAIR